MHICTLLSISRVGGAADLIVPEELRAVLRPCREGPEEAGRCKSAGTAPSTGLGHRLACFAAFFAIFLCRSFLRFFVQNGLAQSSNMRSVGGSFCFRASSNAARSSFSGREAKCSESNAVRRSSPSLIRKRLKDGEASPPFFPRPGPAALRSILTSSRPSFQRAKNRASTTGLTSSGSRDLLSLRFYKRPSKPLVRLAHKCPLVRS